MPEGVSIRRAPALYAPMLRFGIRLDPDAEPGTGAGAGGGAAGSAPAAARRLAGEEAVSLALAQSGRNPIKIAKRMQAEIDRLNGIIDRGATPAGAVVLTKDQAEQWTAYQALGKPDALKTVVAERDTLKAAETARAEQEARETLFVEGAQAFGWNETAARKAARALTVKLERREDEFEVTTNGQTTKVKKPVPYVITGEGATAKAERLDAVIARDHDLYLPALKAASTTDTTSSRTSAPMPPAPRTTGVPDTVPPDAQRAARRQAAGAF